MSDASYPKWKRALLNKKQDLKIALATDNLVNARQNISFHATKSRAQATFLSKGETDKQWDAIKVCAKDTARIFETAMNSFKSDIESGTYDSYKVDRHQFLNKITERKEQLKREVNVKLDDATDDAMNKIENLPIEECYIVGEVYCTCLDIITPIFDRLWDVLNYIMGDISSIMEGRFDSLEKGSSSVKDAVDGALRSIDEVFGSHL
jgi:predicted nucleic acid-binding Zn finger protein